MTETLKVQGKGVFGRYTRGTLECGLTGGEEEEEPGQCNCWKILDRDKGHFQELASSC